ncbi:MAG: ATP-binding protein [Acutalibacteraceae bacterium]
MKIFRNREFKIESAVILILTVVFSVISALLRPLSALVTLMLGICFYVVFYCSSKRRYDRMEKLTDDIDKILHGRKDIRIDDNLEGELSVLQNELSKMLIILNEQNDKLKNEKKFLSDSIADISHQLRTPLTSINLILSLMHEPDITEERRLELLHKLSQLIARTDYLINVLLKMSKIDAGTVTFEKKQVSVKELITRAAEPLEVALELKGQTLQTDITDESFTGDLPWTTEAIGNIIKNCHEHTPQGGTITIKAESTPIYTEITVADSGSGIDKDDLSHIFERFYKGKNSSDNSFGIGLALAQTIITGQDGTIKAANGKNGGAQFTVRFYKQTI